MSFILAFLATGLGKIMAGIFAVIVAAGAGWLKGRLSGAKAERAKQAADQLDAIKDRKQTDDEVASLGPADLDKRMSQWMRDGK